MKALMSVQSVLEAKLKLAFRPEALDVRDESSQHEGHAGARPGGETHYRVYIVAKAFEGKSRVAMHRMINEVLAEELAGPVHALAIHASASGET
jgi:BolA protein